MNLLHRLNTAVASGYLSKAQPFALPKDPPLFACICVVALTQDCLPPQNGIGRRVASGCGSSADRAAFLAMMEAAERYSLQHSHWRPVRTAPFSTVGGLSSSCETEELELGSAVSTDSGISTVGCAAGESLNDAGKRAVLELLEHSVIDEMRQGTSDLRWFDVSRAECLSSHARWCETQLRRLESRIWKAEDGYWVAACACSDLDGSRRSEGHAASLEAETALRSAAEEAILLWRNMIELERSGTTPDQMEDFYAIHLIRYRGAAPQLPFPLTNGGTENETHLSPLAGGSDLSLDALMRALARRTGKRVRLFDLSHRAVGIPVVRGLVG